MAQLGLDVEQMGTLISTLRNQIDAINTIRSTVNAAVDNTWWQGSDADTFRAQWLDFHRQLGTISDTFGDVATIGQGQLDQQQETSGR